MLDETFIRRYFFKNTKICNNIINWYESNKDIASPGNIFRNSDFSIVPEIKESLDIGFNSVEQAISLCSDFLPLLNFLWDCVLDYISVFPEVDTQRFTMDSFNLQGYTPPTGGFKKFHCERSDLGVCHRNLVWMIYLNTVTDQGGTEFKYQKLIEPAEAGKVLIWPTDFTHTHRGIPSPTQSKYILTGWYKFIG